LRTIGFRPDKTEVCGSSPQWPTFKAKNPQNTLPQKGKDHSPSPVFQSYPATLQDLSLSKLIDGFILSYKLEGKSPLTIDGHQRKLKRYLVYVKDNPLTAITPAVIRGFLGWVRDDYNLDAATVQRYFITLKAFYRWAIEEGFTNENPTTKIKLAKPSQKVIRGLLPEQIRIMFGGVRGNSQESARNKEILPGFEL
jgi:site-specific recombinase XerD